LEVRPTYIYPLCRIALEDIITTRHLRTSAHYGTAASIVLDHIAFKKGVGTATY
jgi:hypothetical protein